jgi:acyl-CoA synthetase (AMP-forming)/AMP-acid ligase II
MRELQRDVRSGESQETGMGQENLEMSLSGMLDERASATPDRVLLIDESGRRVTCDEFRTETLRVATNLSDLGIVGGMLVSWVLPTCIDTLVVMAALSRLGTVQNPIIPIYRRREISHIVDEASVDVMIVTPTWRGFDYLGLAKELAVERAGRPMVLQIEDVLSGRQRESHVGEYPSHPNLGEARWIFYTSGSTGLPKGVLHTDATLAAVARGMASQLMMTDADRNGVAFPIAHIGGAINLMASLISGAAIILIEAFEAAPTSETLSREGVTMAGSGTAFHLAYLEVQRARPDHPLFPNLRCCPGGGASKPPGLHEKVKDELGGVGIVSGWGLTEAPVLTMGKPTDSDSKLSETEGTMLPGVRLRVVSTEGKELHTGLTGELRARGPQVMLGYVDSSLDVEAFDEEGYLRTGDLGSIDADGYVRITGRMKDIVIRKGENIGAAEVEDLLRSHESIVDAAVIGIPDELTGERVCAVLEMAAHADVLDIERVGEYLLSRGLRPNAWPEQVEIVSSLPRTAAGKVDKAQLRDDFAEASFSRVSGEVA